MAPCLTLFLLATATVFLLLIGTVASTLECGPGYKVNGNLCEKCPTSTFNSKRDGSTSCSDCLIRCPFQKGVITKNCTTTNDSQCDCKEGYERKTLGELTNCYRKKQTECGPGFRVKGNLCEECKSGTFNSKRDGSTSCSDCLIRCPFANGVITKSCTTTNDLQCGCKEGFEKETTGELTNCYRKNTTVPQENPAKPKGDSPGSHIIKIIIEIRYRSNTDNVRPNILTLVLLIIVFIVMT